MKEDYSDWTLFDLESMVKKSRFIKFLKYILDSYGGDKVLEVLRASGFFISIDDKFFVDQKQKDSVNEFVKSNLNDKFVEKYNNMIHEASILNAKQMIINQDIYIMLDKWKINTEKLIALVVHKWKNIEVNLELKENQHLFMATKESLVLTLGTLIKCINFYSSKNGDLEGYEITEDELEKLLDAAFILREYNEIILSWMFGEIDLISDSEGIEIEEKPRTNMDRLVSAMNFFDIKDIKDLKSELANYEKDCGIAGYVQALEDKIREYFYTNDFKEKYLDIELKDWMTAYTFFAKESYKSNSILIRYKVSILVSKLESEGILHDVAEKMVELFIFTKESKDLYDSFLVEIDDDVALIPEIYLFIDPSRAMISLFGKRDKTNASISQKGTSFEKHIYSLIKNIGNKNMEKNISANDQGETYEVDIVFELGNNLFFCECKTQYQHENIREYYRNRRELEIYLDKFNRNYKYFTENEKGKQIIKNKLGIENTKNCYPIFISNLVYSDAMINQVFITDEPRIYRYMNRVPACVYKINPKLKIVEIGKLFAELYEGDINIKQFFTFLRNKEKEIEIESKRIKLWNNDTLKQYGIISKRFIVDYTSDYLDKSGLQKVKVEDISNFI